MKNAFIRHLLRTIPEEWKRTSAEVECVGGAMWLRQSERQTVVYFPLFFLNGKQNPLIAACGF
jgi:hypothetical protein